MEDGPIFINPRASLCNDDLSTKLIFSHAVAKFIVSFWGIKSTTPCHSQLFPPVTDYEFGYSTFKESEVFAAQRLRICKDTKSFLT